MADVVWLRPRSAPEPEPLWREALGAQLRAERAARGKRISDIAERAGISPQYLSELERGRKDLSSEMLSAVAGALELSVLHLTRRASAQLIRSAGTTRGARGPVCSVARAA
ncbi:MAG TPA: helix-turn-helix transcriptional regulator [Jatrophihabitans sp.]|jgi:transcriptional regulator with XRE-family HTH domain